MIFVNELRVTRVLPLDALDGVRQAGTLATGDIVISNGSSPPHLALEDVALIPFLRGMLYGLLLCNFRSEANYTVGIDEQDAVVIFDVDGGTITRFAITTVMGDVLEAGTLGGGVCIHEIFALLNTVLLACRGAVSGEWSYIFSDPILKDMYRRVLDEGGKSLA